MATWTDDDLAAIGTAEELELASRRADGTMGPFVTMWVVRVGDDLYVRSAHGPDNGWYRRAVASGKGRIRAGGIERDVTFATADPGFHGDVDAADHATAASPLPTSTGRSPRVDQHVRTVDDDGLPRSLPSGGPAP
jgi:hypothetical protein